MTVQVHRIPLPTGRRVGVRVSGLICLLLALATIARAKEPMLSAIEVYDGPNGAAYVQLNGVLINGKAELRGCPQCESAPIDKSTYGKLAKFGIGPGGTLERGKDGILRYTDSRGVTTVVVPNNVKFEKRPSMSASELADQSNLKASPATAGSAVPPLAPGVTLVFVAAPDVELAEYLRARRASDIPGWQAYLQKYGSSSHSTDARLRLGTLYAQAGAAKLANYEKSTGTASPAYDDLREAHTLAQQARSMSASTTNLPALDQGIAAAQAALVEKGHQELDLYRAALKAHTPGYVHLGNALKYTDLTEGVVTTPAGQALMGEVVKDSNAVQSAIRQAESSVTAKQFDAAMGSIGPYRAFASEEPRIAAVMDAAYGYHMDRARKAAAAPNWQDAIAEYTKAGAIKETPENRSQLADARHQWGIVQDKDAADKALEASKEYEASKDFLHAYEVLDSLPASQRKLVGDDIERLKPNYITRSSSLAADLRKAHGDIRGVGDETEIERAYNYLDHAYKLSENESYNDRMNLLGDLLSGYLLDQSKHYISKPGGSGTELGWAFLQKALPYKASNLDAVRDAQTSVGPAHRLRSKLSIRVQFRDPTSQSDTAGYAVQLENALIAGLEGSKVPVKVVRANEQTPVGIDTDYLIEGDVLQHHLTTVPVLEPIESKYLLTTREVPSDEWNKANRVYEKAKMDLDTAQRALQVAQAKGNKHVVETDNKEVDKCKKAVDDAMVALDSTPKTVSQDVIRPYTYTKKTVTLTASIQVQFRINDLANNERGEMVPIIRDEPKKYVVLENVKPEDTEGVKTAGTPVDPTEFMSSVENNALQALVNEVRKRVEDLPKQIYKQARTREDGGDTDGAGESYLRYLELTVQQDNTVEQSHAREFLLQHFNITPEMNLASR